MLFSVDQLGEVGQVLLIAAQEWAGRSSVGGEKLNYASLVSLGLYYFLSLLLNENNMIVVIILISIMSIFEFVSVIKLSLSHPTRFTSFFPISSPHWGQGST